jgi:hypothetical protein
MEFFAKKAARDGAWREDRMAGERRAKEVEDARDAAAALRERAAEAEAAEAAEAFVQEQLAQRRERDSRDRKRDREAAAAPALSPAEVAAAAAGGVAKPLSKGEIDARYRVDGTRGHHMVRLRRLTLSNSRSKRQEFRA